MRRQEVAGFRGDGMADDVELEDGVTCPEMTDDGGAFFDPDMALSLTPSCVRCNCFEGKQTPQWYSVSFPSGTKQNR